ncbi:MAG: UDP-3-O-acylglucosamine N-acyltransferase [Cyclobacteriaceae bacterium]|nr:MAG: UDP-3-O-acylglucosamine N-acyltransferase [Cyclobacteriaceae bacterium]
MQFTINQLAELLGGEVIGNGEAKVNNIGPLDKAGPGTISFLHNPKYEPQLYTTKAEAVIVNRKLQLKEPIEPVLIAVEDPYSSLTVLLEQYQKLTESAKEGVEEPAFLGEGAEVGNSVYRGAFSYIGKNTTIGNNVKIYPNAYIGDNAKIGDNSIIFAGVKIYSGCIIGNNCVIHAGAVIGSDGFGFAPQEDGSYQAIPQVGIVILEDHVRVGANTTIDCGTLEATVIRSGVKLDNLIQIAHNVEIGENTAVAAQAGISGSAKIGKNCIIAGQAGITGHLAIADRVTIGAQAGIPKSVTKEGSILLGSPAIDIMNFKRSFTHFKNLPDMAGRINDLEKKVLNLPPSEK